MGKSAKRLAFLLLIIALVWGGAVPSGWAKERRSFVKEAWAWEEAGDLRIQASLSRADEELVVGFRQDGQEASYSLRGEKRFSVAVRPSAENSPLTVEWRVAGEEKPILRWRIPVPDTVSFGENGIEVREAPWDRHAGEREDRLELENAANWTPERKSDEESADQKSEPVESDGPSRQQAKVERWADDFYTEYSGDKKPTEVELRSRKSLFEMEPNDSFSKADWLFDATDAYGRIGKSGDVDTWKIKATSNGTMNVTLRDIPAGQDYSVYVFSEEDQELARSEQPGSADEEIEGIRMERGAWYYIQVKGSKDSYHKDYYYRLRADFMADQGDGKLDQYEPNDSVPDAYELPIDYSSKIQGNLHSLSDTDFYRIGMTLASTIKLELNELPTGMDVDLYLLDETGNKVLGKSEKPKNASEQIVFQADPGTYLVKVAASKRSGFTPNSYSLHVAIETIPVILIPGIGGSRLEAEEDGKISEIWLGLADSLIGINDPRHRRLLSLEPIRPNSVDVKPRESNVKIFPERADEGFSAIEYLSYTPLDPVRNMTEEYYSMVKQLEKMGYKKFRTLFAMPYDWRYSNAKNAAELKQKIDTALERSGAGKVQLVAHSMGGLLIRETLLNNISYQSKVHRVIYMGTPFLGAPRAYQAIRYGYNFSIPWMDEGTGKIISEYAPAVYELLPSKKYFQTAGFLKKNQNDPYSYDEFLQDKAIRLSYSPLVKQAGKLHEKWDNKTINVPQYSIIGQGEPTLLGYFFDAYHQTWTPYYDKGMGDGTVPYLSASYAQKDIKKKYYVKGEHAKLPTIPEVIGQVTQLLKGDETTQPGLRKSASNRREYLTYILSRADGGFPEVTIAKAGKKMTLSPTEKEVWDDLSIEYHGNLVVIHVKDGEELEFVPVHPEEEAGFELRIERFSSEDSEEEQETGKRYRLDQEGMREMHSDSR